MGIKEWWKWALGDFKDSKYRDLSEFKGKRFAVDFSIFANKLCSKDVDKLATTCSPRYAAPNLLQYMMELHRNLSRDIVPVYVFDGIPPPIKQKQEDKRRATRMNEGKAYLDIGTRTSMRWHSFHCRGGGSCHGSSDENEGANCFRSGYHSSLDAERGR